MLIATKSVDFSFNNMMYVQIDGVAMGSPLGPVLANISCGLFDNVQKPSIYYQYVDGNFDLFCDEKQTIAFLSSNWAFSSFFKIYYGEGGW